MPLPVAYGERGCSERLYVGLSYLSKLKLALVSQSLPIALSLSLASDLRWLGCFINLFSGGTFWYNVTVLVKMDFNELIKVDPHLLNHSRLLHSMVCTSMNPPVCYSLCPCLCYSVTTTCSVLGTTLPADHSRFVLPDRLFRSWFIPNYWMSAALPNSSNNIDLSAALVDFAGLLQGQVKDILKYRVSSSLSDVCASFLSVQFWVCDWLSHWVFRDLQQWCVLIRSSELNLSRGKADLQHWDPHGRWSSAVKLQDYGRGLCLGQGHFVGILAIASAHRETAGCCFCCRTKALSCAWISSGIGNTACMDTWQQHGVPLPMADIAGRKSPREPRRTQPWQSCEVQFPKGESTGRTRLQSSDRGDHYAL